MPSCAFFLEFLEEKRKQEGKGRSKEGGKESKVMPFYCKERCGRTLLERERDKRQGDVMLSCAFLFGFLEEKGDKRERHRGEEGGKEGKVIPFLLQGTLREKPFRKGKGGKRQGHTMPACAFLLDFLEKKKTVGKDPGADELDGRQGYVLFASNVVGETF